MGAVRMRRGEVLVAATVVARAGAHVNRLAECVCELRRLACYSDPSAVSDSSWLKLLKCRCLGHVAKTGVVDRHVTRGFSALRSRELQLLEPIAPIGHVSSCRVTGTQQAGRRQTC